MQASITGVSVKGLKGCKTLNKDPDPKNPIEGREERSVISALCTELLVEDNLSTNIQTIDIKISRSSFFFFLTMTSLLMNWKFINSYLLYISTFRNLFENMSLKGTCEKNFPSPSNCYVHNSGMPNLFLDL